MRLNDKYSIHSLKLFLATVLFGMGLWGCAAPAVEKSLSAYGVGIAVRPFDNCLVIGGIARGSFIEQNTDIKRTDLLCNIVKDDANPRLADIPLTPRQLQVALRGPLLSKVTVAIKDANGSNSRNVTLFRNVDLETGQAFPVPPQLTATVSKRARADAALGSCLEQRDIALCEQYVAANLGTAGAQAATSRIKKIQLINQQEQALPPEIRRDRYMSDLRKALEARDYSGVEPLAIKLFDLGLPIDPSVRFFYGEALYEQGDMLRALEELYQYVTEEGATATYYTQALGLISKAEAAL